MRSSLLATVDRPGSQISPFFSFILASARHQGILSCISFPLANPRITDAARDSERQTTRYRCTVHIVMREAFIPLSPTCTRICPRMDPSCGLCCPCASGTKWIAMELHSQTIPRTVSALLALYHNALLSSRHPHFLDAHLDGLGTCTDSSLTACSGTHEPSDGELCTHSAPHLACGHYFPHPM